MLRSGLGRNKVLVHGVSYLNQFYFQEELSHVAGVDYRRCCSREGGNGVFEGRVTDYLRSLDKFPADMLFYVCGKALMVVEVRDMLIEKGIPYGNIVAEIYF
jgi:ferredoxin--NADP+ reductase